MTLTYAQRADESCATALTVRCDATASGSEAATRTVTTPAGELALCSHHTARYGPALLAAGYAVTSMAGQGTAAGVPVTAEDSVPGPVTVTVPDASPGDVPGMPACRHCRAPLAELSPRFWVHDQAGMAACGGSLAMGEPV